MRGKTWRFILIVWRKKKSSRIKRWTQKKRLGNEAMVQNQAASSSLFLSFSGFNGGRSHKSGLIREPVVASRDQACMVQKWVTFLFFARSTFELRLWAKAIIIGPTKDMTNKFYGFQLIIHILLQSRWLLNYVSPSVIPTQSPSKRTQCTDQSWRFLSLFSKSQKTRSCCLTCLLLHSHPFLFIRLRFK